MLHYQTCMLIIRGSDLPSKHVFPYKYVYHSTNTSKHALVFLKLMVNEHVFVNLLPLSLNSSPQQLWDLAK